MSDRTALTAMEKGAAWLAGEVGQLLVENARLSEYVAHLEGRVRRAEREAQAAAGTGTKDTEGEAAP